MPFIAKHILEKCTHCNACLELVACPGVEENICIGCGACTLLCPNEAIILVESKRKNTVNIEVDNKKVFVSEKISIKEALSEIGFSILDLPEEPEKSGESKIFAPCGVGACSSCFFYWDPKYLKKEVMRCLVGVIRLWRRRSRAMR